MEFKMDISGSLNIQDGGTPKFIERILKSANMKHVKMESGNYHNSNMFWECTGW